MHFEELSKEISYALRHAPWEYELEMDEEGWVSLNQLLKSLQVNPKWEKINEDDVRNMIGKSEKKRHEIKEGMIRACYGHSIPQKIIKEKRTPPKYLYHGTSRFNSDSILKNGLQPRERQYVHMSQDKDTAEVVGKRRDSKPVILLIDAKVAWEEGVSFYFGNEKVWLADFIPSKYISIINMEGKT